MTEERNFTDAPIDSLVKKILPDFILQLLKAYGYVNLGDLAELSEEDIEGLEVFVTTGMLSSRVDLNDPTVRTKYLGNAKPSSFSFLPIEKRKLRKLKAEAELEIERLKFLHDNLKRKELARQEERTEIICRLCLNKNVDVVPLFYPSQASQSPAADYVKEIIPEIKVQRQDGFSQNVCKTCLSVLVSACDLRAKSIENDKNLKQSNVCCQDIKDEPTDSNCPIKITSCISLNEVPSVQMDPLEICLSKIAAQKRKLRSPEISKKPKMMTKNQPNTEATNESKDLVEIYFQDATTDASKPNFRCLLCQKKLRGDFAIYRLIPHIAFLYFEIN